MEFDISYGTGSPEHGPTCSSIQHSRVFSVLKFEFINHVAGISRHALRIVLGFATSRRALSDDTGPKAPALRCHSREACISQSSMPANVSSAHCTRHSHRRRQQLPRQASLT